MQNHSLPQGSECCSVGRAVACDTRGMQFEYSRRQNFKMNMLNVEKTKKEKRGRKWPIVKNHSVSVFNPRNKVCPGLVVKGGDL